MLLKTMAQLLLLLGQTVKKEAREKLVKISCIITVEPRKQENSLILIMSNLCMLKTCIIQ